MLQENEQAETTPIAIKILTIIPGAVAVMVKVGQFGFAFYNSQETRINRVLEGAKKNVANELGFMHKIKEEVSLYSQYTAQYYHFLIFL